MTTNNKFHSNEVEKQMVQEYLNGASSKELMSRYGYKTRKSITDKVKKHMGENFDFKTHLAQKKNYSLDFSTIDSPFKAYFIGLMITDGYVSDERKFGIDLKDEDCIRFISESTGQTYTSYPGYQEGQEIKYRILFSNRDNVAQLKRYGILPRKTHLLEGFEWGKEEEKYIPYFIRGVIDGDGSIFKTTYGEIAFAISSSNYGFILWIRDILTNKMFVFELTESQNLKTGVWSLSSALKRNIEILKILSYDRPFGMARKYNRLYEQASETIMETPKELGDGIVQTATE